MQYTSPYLFDFRKSCIVMNVFQQNTNTIGHQTRDTVVVVRPRQPVLVREFFRCGHHVNGFLLQFTASHRTIYILSQTTALFITHSDFVDSSTTYEAR